MCNFRNYEWAIDDDGCITPSRGSGSCISIFDCQPIIDFMMRAPKPLSSEHTRILQRYQCGFQNNVKVCCPNNPNEISQMMGENNQRNDPDPPDVSDHINLRLLPQNCGVINTYDKIINGNKTGLFEFPWMALISYRTTRGPEFRCGGTVINNRYILTAAHCITGLSTPLLGVRVGEHDVRTRIDCETVGRNVTTCAPPVQDIGIATTIPHPNYERASFSHDIGLIRLSSNINTSVESVSPICMPVLEASTYNFTNRNVIVTGFGATETGRNSPELLKVEIPYIEREVCRRNYQGQAPVTYRQLCAGGRNQQDSCGGDSGGPLQVVQSLFDDARYVQHGVTSFGPRLCGSEGNPGVYTRVAYYMDWILDNIRR